VSLTSYTGRELHPAFSPDGTQVAFSWNGEKQDNWDIYARLVGASGPSLRLTTDPASDTFPAWSPDGRQIAFRRTPRAGDHTTPIVQWPSPAGTVMVMPALGGPERKVADVPEARCPTLSWTPDGRWLATPATGPSGGNGIFLLPLEQGATKLLTSNPTGEDIGPMLSADGRSLAFVSCRSFYACAIQVLELEQDLQPRGAPRRLIEVQLGATFAGLAWAADGQGLLYSLGNLYRVPLRGARAGERIALATPLAVFPAVSRTRNRLAFAHGIDDRDIWKLEEAGRPCPSSPPRPPTRIRSCRSTGRESPTCRERSTSPERTARTPCN